MTTIETVQWKARGSKKDCSLSMNFAPDAKLAFYLIDLPESATEDCEDAYLQFEFFHTYYDEDSQDELISTSSKFCNGDSFIGDEGKLFVLDTAANDAGQPVINLFKAKMVKTKKR